VNVILHSPYKFLLQHIMVGLTMEDLELSYKNHQFYHLQFLDSEKHTS